MVAMEEGLASTRYDQPIVYWRVYEGACGVVSSWTKNGDMAENHDHC